MAWKKLKPLPASAAHQGCLNCPPPKAKLKMTHRIGVGFGYAAVLRDGKSIWMEDDNQGWSDLWTVQKAENRARKDPDHDWRIVMDGPMHGETYQRQGKNLWVLVKSNHGFA